MPAPKPILWINHAELFEISRKLDPLLSGCHYQLLNASAAENDEMSEIAAISILASVPGADEAGARKILSEIEASGLVNRRGNLLTLTMYGTTIVPDYDDWN